MKIKLNKKQLTVVWVMGLALIFLVTCTPRLVINTDGTIIQREVWFDFGELSTMAHRVVDWWGIVIPYSICILIFGFLLLYTIRDYKE